MKNMVLHVATKKVGSECIVDIGLTEEEWNELTEDEQSEATNDVMWNVIDAWVEAVDE